MFAQVNGLTTCSIDGVMILVEVDISNGLPNFDLVGLPAMAVRESKERVKAAMRNSDYPFPMTKILISLRIPYYSYKHLAMDNMVLMVVSTNTFLHHS